MKLVGFNFSKIYIEKFTDISRDLKINTNINVSELKPLKSEIFKSKEEVILVKFTYVINYDPEGAKLEFEGNTMISIEPKKAKAILKEWKDKKMPDDFRNALFNLIMMKSNIKALQLEDELNLPYHIPLPTLKIDDKDAKKKK